MRFPNNHATRSFSLKSDDRSQRMLRENGERALLPNEFFPDGKPPACGRQRVGVGAKFRQSANETA